MQVKFLDNDYKITLTNVGENKNIVKEKDVDLMSQTLNLKKKESKTLSKLDEEVEELQESVLNSLNYVSNQNMLPSFLPEELNVKFLNVSKFAKLKDRIFEAPMAQLEDPNTMYVSTKLLPKYQESSSNTLISNLYSKFQNPQQVLDLVVFHELGHLVFNHSFPDFNQLNQDLLSNKSVLERWRDKFLSENHEKIPLYQMNRSLEESFADSYSAMVLFERYGVKPEDFIHMRNGKDYDGRGITKGFNIDIYRLHDNFKDLQKIDYKKIGIDGAIKEIYELSLKGSKEIMKYKIFYLSRDNTVVNRLESNLNDFDIKIENGEKYREKENNILNKAEELIRSKGNFGNITDRLDQIEKNHSQLNQESSNKSEKNKKT